MVVVILVPTVGSGTGIGTTSTGVGSGTGTGTGTKTELVLALVLRLGLRLAQGLVLYMSAAGFVVAFYPQRGRWEAGGHAVRHAAGYTMKLASAVAAWRCRAL